MADSFDVLIERLKAVREGILKDGIEIAKEMALTHKAIVVRRIQSQGIPEERYSEKGIPMYFVEQNPYARLNSGFERLVKDKKESRETVAWKDVRSYQGLQTEFVDFTFSGRTFKNWTIVNIRIDGGANAVAELGGTEEETKNRLAYGRTMYGDFLSPNEEEKKQLMELVELRTKETLKKYQLI